MLMIVSITRESPFRPILFIYLVLLYFFAVKGPLILFIASSVLTITPRFIYSQPLFILFYFKNYNKIR